MSVVIMPAGPTPLPPVAALPPADFAAALTQAPLLAILDGLPPQDAESVGRALLRFGITLAVVPQTGPEAADSLACLARLFAGRGLVGLSGTGDPERLDAAARRGAQMALVRAETAAILAARRCGLAVVGLVDDRLGAPAVVSAALAAGVDALAVRPGADPARRSLAALAGLVAERLPVLAVGGVNTANMAACWRAGARGFGVGSALYRRGDSAPEVASRAYLFGAAVAETCGLAVPV